MIQPQVLRYFAEVARTGSLRQASEVLFVAPSAIGKQIGNLEKALGTELFDRSPRGMVLTAAGRALREFVAESEVRIDLLRSSIDDLSAMRRGTVRIALVEAAVQSTVPDILTGLSREYPGIRFHLEVCGTARIVEALIHQSADIGMAFNVLIRDDVTLHGRSVQPLQLICRPEHPLGDRKTVSMNELAGARAALPGSSFGIRYLIDQAAAAAGIELDVVYEANSLQTLKNLGRRSDVISFMPPLTFVHEAELGWLRSIPLAERDSEAATIDVITARNRKLSAAAPAFLGHVTVRFLASSLEVWPTALGRERRQAAAFWHPHRVTGDGPSDVFNGDRAACACEGFDENPEKREVRTRTLGNDAIFHQLAVE